MKLELDGNLKVEIETTNKEGLSLKEVQGRLIALKRELESYGCEVSISLRPEEGLTCRKCGHPMRIEGTVSEVVVYNDHEFYLWRCQCGHEETYDLVEYADFP